MSEFAARALIAPDQTVAILAVLLAASLLGIVGDARGWFRHVSGILVTLVATAVLAIFHVLPSSLGPADVPAYDLIGSYIMPIAIPLLLFDADLRRIARESGRLLTVFCLGAATAVAGIFVAVAAIRLGPDEWLAATLFAATWTGGLNNLMAVADIFQVRDSAVFVNVVTADGFLNMLLMVVLFLLPSCGWLAHHFVEAGPERPPGADGPSTRAGGTWTLEGATAALTISMGLLAIAHWVSPLLKSTFALNFRPHLIVLTILTLALVNLRPEWFSRLTASAFPMGVLCLYLFIAEIGVGVDVLRLVTEGPAVLLFGSIAISVHLALLLLAGKWLQFSLKEICIASNACIGGPTTAAPMALSFGMAATPAIMVGLFGYMIGTFVALWVGAVLRSAS